MTRVFGLLAILSMGCSSHWSEDAQSPPLEVDLAADTEARLSIGADLVSNEDETLPCDSLLFDLAIQFPVTSGNVDFEVFEAGGDTAIHSGSADLSAGGVADLGITLPFVQDGDNCLLDLEIAITSDQAIVGDVVAMAIASDSSAGPDDEPEGEVAFTVSAAVIAE
jgi:hypothetical protein